MKKYLKYIPIFIYFLFTACSDYLDIQPTDRITPDELFNDPNGVKAYLATLYSELPIEDYMYMPGTNDNGSAGFYNPKGNIGLFWLANVTEEAIQSQWGEEGPGYLLRNDYFNKGYVTIRDINLFKSMYETLDLQQSEKDVFKGESAFMMAYVYFYLAQKFGGVPLIKELQEYDPSDRDGLVVPRSTEKETWEYVMAQCDTAAKYLPEQPEGRRASKWAALALQSRAALVAASIAKFGDKIQLSGEAVDLGLAGMKSTDANYFYNKCINASEAIMNPESGHGLYKPNPANPEEAEANYRTIFTNPNGVDNEALFIKGILKEGAGFGSSINKYWEPNQTKGMARVSPTLDLVDVYEDYTDNGNQRSDGRIKTRLNDNFSASGFSKNIDDYIKVDREKPYDLFNGVAYGDSKKAKDARLWASIILPGTQWKGTKIIMQGGLITQDGEEIYRVSTSVEGKDGVMYQSLGGTRGNVSGFFPSGEFSMSGFLLKKMISENDQAEYDKSTLDFIVFRYAEVLLNYAEAVVESGLGDAQKAKDALNAVRKRAAHTNDIELTRDNVRKERMIELAFENIRIWDLKRWRELHILYSNYSHQILVPMLDLREDDPNLIFVRKTTQGASLNGPKSYSMSEYYEDVPRNEINKMIQNP